MRAGGALEPRAWGARGSSGAMRPGLFLRILAVEIGHLVSEIWPMIRGWPGDCIITCSECVGPNCWLLKKPQETI